MKERKKSSSVEEMHRKRKPQALDPECQPPQEKRMVKHLNNSTNAMEEDMNIISGMESDLESKNCDIILNSHLEETAGKDFDTSLQATDAGMIAEKEDMSSGSVDDVPEVKSSSSTQPKCLNGKGKSKSFGIFIKDDVSNSLQTGHHNFFADISLVPSVSEMNMVRQNSEQPLDNDLTPQGHNGEGLSKSVDFDIVKQTNVAAALYLNSNKESINNSKKLKVYSKRTRNKLSGTNSVVCSSFPVDQDCTSANPSSLPRIAEMGLLEMVSSEISPSDNLMSSVEKENGALSRGACVYSDKSGMLPEISSNSDMVNNNAIEQKETENEARKKILSTENKGRKEVLSFSHCNSELDRNSPIISRSPSKTVVLDLVERKNVDASVENKLVLKVDTEDNHTTKVAVDTPVNESHISFEIALDSIQVEDLSFQTELAKEREADETLSCSSHTIEHSPENMPDAVLHASGRDVVGYSNKAFVSEAVQSLRDKKTKQLSCEARVSNDTFELDNLDSLDEFHNVPLAYSFSGEGSLKAPTTECREPPSPIRGVMHEYGSLYEPNKTNKRLDSLKEEEVSFSFQIADKTLVATSDNDPEKACASRSEVASDTSPPIKKDSVSNCSRNETTNGQVVNRVAYLSSGLIADHAFPFDAINIQDKKLEAVTPPPERIVVASTRRKLLVLDLNGLLADIILDIRNVHRAQRKVGGKSVFKRPFCDDFLRFCFEKFDIGVWSSRRRYNVEHVIDYLIGDRKHKLLFCWDQSKCTETGFRTLENVHKPLVLKELKKLWDKEETDLPWEKGYYSESNTLLVDDSPYKALCNPPHTAIFPYPYRWDDENDTSLGPGGDLRVYLEGIAVAENVQCYVREHPFGQEAITNSHASWNFYAQVTEKVQKSVARIQIYS